MPEKEHRAASVRVTSNASNVPLPMLPGERGRATAALAAPTTYVDGRCRAR
jgi:hypothetical protein